MNNDPKKTIDSNTRDKNAEVDGDNENDVENGHLNDTFFMVTATRTSTRTRATAKITITTTTKQFGRRQRR